MMGDAVATDEEVRAVYERAFRSLLWRLQPQRLQRGVERLLHKADGLAQEGLPTSQALAEVYRQAAARTLRKLSCGEGGSRRTGESGARLNCSSARRRMIPQVQAQLARPPVADSPDFHCDAPLGGLARWLRAAGYDACWWPDVDDDALIRTALASSAILLTTDRPMVRRGVFTHGVLPAVLVPVSFTKREQFDFVVTKLELPLKPPRCMACGGRQHQVPKTQVRDRIPPRTYPWLDAYFVCERCDRLYWKGTHWPPIEEQLRQAVGAR